MLRWYEKLRRGVYQSMNLEGYYGGNIFAIFEHFIRCSNQILLLRRQKDTGNFQAILFFYQDFEMFWRNTTAYVTLFKSV